ncbi:hypothetical protein BLOT_015389 [Blomia tropicalis]|nr:hypothetical protein BLOT_015389 [Blomia tropicalis]
MSFVSVPESTTILTGSLQYPSNHTSHDNDEMAEQERKSGCCYLICYWTFRLLPLMIIFLIINCIRAIFFDQPSAYTMINIAIGLIMVSLVFVSLYTFISVQYYRMKTRTQSSFSRISTISGVVQRDQHNHHQRRHRPPNGPDDNNFVLDFMEGLIVINNDDHRHRNSNRGRANQCPRCVQQAAGTSNLPTTTNHHLTCPNRTPMIRPIVEKCENQQSQFDCPPAYEDPPQYDQCLCPEYAFPPDKKPKPEQ